MVRHGAALLFTPVALTVCMVVAAGVSDVSAAEDPGDPARGRDLLLGKPYLSGDFDRRAFDALWAVWPAADRDALATSTDAQRRKLIVERYGLHERPGWGGDLNEPPVSHVVTPDGWAMNCFACHAGSVAGQPTMLGLPNSHFAMQSFAEDLFAVKLRQFRRPAGIELGAQVVPLNATDGRTNAVIFGIAVGASRDRDVNIVERRPEELIHHDMDAPPWWHAKKKSTLYCDAYAPKTHRVIMPFVMSHRNDGPTVRGWEPDFRDILAFIESVEAPAYPFGIDRRRADMGMSIFTQRCADCHGTYGDDWAYPEVVVDIETLGTDPVRFRALTPEHRQWTEDGWLGRYGEDQVVRDPVGYLAPPLDGVWASAPYLHNGSVPTLWHLMHPESRPSAWRRTRDGYDQERVGLELDYEGEVLPQQESHPKARRYFWSERTGMSMGGHEFFGDLSEDEKLALIEYLKTL